MGGIGGVRGGIGGGDGYPQTDRGILTLGMTLLATPMVT